MAQAHAKLNLFLHITRRRADGFHDLETLVAFTDLADTLEVGISDSLSLELDGEFAAMCGPQDKNLVIRAARLLQQASGTSHGAALRLVKSIPAGAGLGGGSADAALALRLLTDHWQLGCTAKELVPLARKLGADVAMCLQSTPLLASGTGEKTVPAVIPTMHAVLVYPNKPLSTAQVYAMLEIPSGKARKGDTTTPAAAGHGQLAMPGLAEAVPESFHAFIAMLERSTRNDLQRPAIGLMPDVAEILLALQTIPGPSRLVRMTGSGSACFALVESPRAAETLALSLSRDYPGWWIRATGIRL